MTADAKDAGLSSPHGRPPRVAFILAICLLLYLFGRRALAQDTASLTGVVTDPASVPVAKVSVVLGSLDRSFDGETSADGNFRFAPVPAGTYELELSAEGYVQQKVAVSLSKGESHLRIVLLPLLTVPDTNYCGPRATIRYGARQSTGPRITGTVRNYSDNSPLAGAELLLLRASEKRPILTIHSDREGKFSFTNPPAGFYALRVLRRHYRPIELKGFLISRENGAAIDFPMLERTMMVACE
jgi:hypothetical protein